MTRLRPWVLPAAVHLGAAAVLAFVLTRGTSDIGAAEGLDPMLESGKWAMRLLLLCLAMSPLATYLGWSGATRLRKPLGLWAFGFALVHLVYFVRADIELLRLRPPLAGYILLGILAMLILAALAATSTRAAMRRLGKAWKRLHRLVYLAGCAVVAHALLAAVSSKRVLVRDPQTTRELQLAAAVVAVLLVVRVPAVRGLLLPLLAPLRRRRAAMRPAASVVPPVGAPAVPPPAAAPAPPRDTWRPPSPAPPAEEEEGELVEV